MASKTSILHVGLHKTATSSFQHTCGTNRAALTAQGLHYPRFSIDERVIYNHSIPIFTLFSGRPERYKVLLRWGYADQIDRVRAMFSEQLDAAVAGHEHLLLSGEDISNLPPKGLEALKSYLGAAGFELRVLCTVRRPYSFMCSRIQQHVRAGLLGDFRSVAFPGASGRIKRLKKCFRQVEFSSFEQDCTHPEGPVSALLERIGVDREQIIERPRQNESPGNATTRLYAAINREYPVLKEGKLNPVGREAHLENFDDEKFLMLAEELALYRQSFEEENAKLSELLGEGFCDNDYPVSAPVCLDSATATQMLSKDWKLPHVRDVVENFVLAHLDPALTMDDLSTMVRAQMQEEEEEEATAATPPGRLTRAFHRIRRMFQESP